MGEKPRSQIGSKNPILIVRPREKLPGVLEVEGEERDPFANLTIP